MTLKATFDGKVLVPEKAIDLAPGTVVEVQVTVPGQAREGLLRRLARIAEEFPEAPDAPADGAAQHDHYLYGIPKNEE